MFVNDKCWNNPKVQIRNNMNFVKEYIIHENDYIDKYCKIGNSYKMLCVIFVALKE